MKDNTGILCLQLYGLSLMTMIVVKNAVLSAVPIFLFCKFARFGQTD